MVQKGSKRKGNYPVAQYIYKEGDAKHPYEWANCRECGERTLMKVHGAHFCSIRCSQMGERNTIQQKNSHHGLTKVQYVQAHQLVGKNRGKASQCINGCEGRTMYHWANISGDYWNVLDYQEMCVPCHDKFDRNRHGE